MRSAAAVTTLRLNFCCFEHLLPASWHKTVGCPHLKSEMHPPTQSNAELYQQRQHPSTATNSETLRTRRTLAVIPLFCST